MGVEQWRGVASTPSLALPLQGGGDRNDAVFVLMDYLR
jgi:hypothetical protein